MPLLRGAMFKNLPVEAVAAISQACAWRRFAAGERILFRDDPGRDVLFVQGGRVRATTLSGDGREVIMREIGEGYAIGDYAAIDGLPRSADVMALEETLVARLPAAQFLRLLNEHPEFMEAELRSLTGVIRALTERVHELATLSVQQRIQMYLLRQARGGAGPRVEVSSLPTAADIAAELATRREAVSREFARLARRGVLRRGRRAAVIDVPALRAELERLKRRSDSPGG